MIYIKDIYRSSKRLIVEKQAYNEQSFYRLERCSVDTLSTLFLVFCFNLYCDVYLFFQISIMKSFRILFSQYFDFVFLIVVILLFQI